MRMQRAVEVFVADRALEFSLAPKTAKLYQQTLMLMLAPVLKDEVPDINIEHLKVLLKAQRKSIKAGTYAVRLTIIKLFTRWLAREKMWPTDPLERYRPKREHRQMPRYIDSMEEILDMASRLDPTSPHAIRDRAMLLVSYSGALRPGEMYQLQMRDYLPSHNPPALHVKTLKRGDERYALLFPMAHQALEEYLRMARGVILAGRPDPKWLFVGNAGKRVSAMYWWKTIKALGQAAGISQEISPHTLRHSAATHLARSGIGAWELQAYLGHRSPLSTAVYVHMIDRDVIKGFKRAMPFEASKEVKS